MLKLNKFKSTIKNANSYIDQSPFNGAISFILFSALFEKSNYTIEEALEILENSEVLNGFYSNFFHEYFKDHEEYDNFVKNQTDISFFNLAKYEEMRDQTIFFNSDHDINELFTQSAEKIEALRIETISTLKAFIEYKDLYNSLIDSYNNGELSLEDIFIDFNYNDCMDSMFFYCNNEHESNEIKQFHINFINPLLENLPTIIAAFELSKELEEAAPIAAAPKTKKLKI